jgi:hypothetical protein
MENQRIWLHLRCFEGQAIVPAAGFPGGWTREKWMRY